jgi:hypothetical protein
VFVAQVGIASEVGEHREKRKKEKERKERMDEGREIRV